ncbi:MAG: amidohydrolase [Betaproteobacteria bacterium]|nr:amidohydrolase [Betaproteobacteria bacterium]
MKIIDADGHIVESAGELRSYLEQPYQDTAFDVVTDSRGNSFFLVEGRLVPKPAGKGAGTPRGFGGVGPQGVYGAAKTGFNKERLSGDLDREGIDLHVIYPTFLLGLCGIENKDNAAALARAYNNWMAEICKEMHGRVAAVAVVPLQDVSAAIEEMRRASNLGLCGVTVPATVFDRNLEHPALFPFFQEAEKLNLAVAVHSVTGAYPIAGADRYDKFFFSHTLAMSFPTMAAMLSLVCGGVVARLPKLRVAFLEIGIGWVPYWMERMDEHYEKHELRNELGKEVPYLTREPSEYVKAGNIFVTCEPDEKTLPDCLRHTGEELPMYASDYPHGDSKFPETVALLRDRGDLTSSAKEKILGLNAARFYNLESN